MIVCMVNQKKKINYAYAELRHSEKTLIWRNYCLMLPPKRDIRGAAEGRHVQENML